METPSIYEQAHMKVKARWGNGWNLLNDELRRGLAAAELLDMLAGVAPLATSNDFATTTKTAIHQWQYSHR